MSKDIALIVALPADLKAWVDEQASQIGLEAVTWLRMQVFAMRKEATSGYRAPPREFSPFIEAEPQGEADGESIDLDALVARQLNEAEQAGLAAPPEHAAPSLDTGNVRSLHRPPPPFSVATTPAWLRGIG